MIESGVLADLGFPADWGTAPLHAVAPRTKASGRADLQPLSVYLEAGVVPRSERPDNHNALGEDLSRYLHVLPGDVVFNKLRTWQGGLGVARDEGIVSPAYFVCRPRPIVEPRFLDYLLRSAPYLAELTRRSKWMPPSQFDIPWDGLRTLPIAVPPLAEQRRIADFLDTETAHIDALVRLRSDELGLLGERRGAVVRDLVIGARHRDRRPSTLPWCATLPAAWNVVPLKYVAKYGSGHTPSRTHPEYWVDCEIPWISLFDVGKMRDPRHLYLSETEQKISELGIANSSATVHPKGTVVLSRTASVGFATIMGTDMAVSQHFATWTCGPRLAPEYLLHLLRTMAPLFDSLKVGTTNVTVFMPDLLALHVPLPSLDEQHRIAERVREHTTVIDGLANALERQVELLGERRRALITAAVTGQLDVTTAP